ncbi:MAG: hypothetical protein AB1424_01490 [Thermodesulfobacteriota bacterium]
MLPYQVSQDVHTCVQGKITGRITQIQAESFSQNMEPGLGMDVQTPDRGVVHVHLGPMWFLDRQETDLKPGEEVTIEAFCYKLAGQERVIAGEVTHKDHKLVLRGPPRRSLLGGLAEKVNLLSSRMKIGLPQSLQEDERQCAQRKKLTTTNLNSIGAKHETLDTVKPC